MLKPRTTENPQTRARRGLASEVPTQPRETRGPGQAPRTEGRFPHWGPGCSLDGFPCRSELRAFKSGAEKGKEAPFRLQINRVEM